MPNPTENKVTLAAKLYDARRVMRSLFGARFNKKIEPYKALILDHCQKLKKEEIGVTMGILSNMQESGVGGIPQALLLAALVEIIEPST